VLATRRGRVMKLLIGNAPMLMFLAYGAISCGWSDYPDVAFKRWIKALSDIVMVLIILSDRDPLAALKRVMAWSGFLLLPLSVLLIKYYPDIGRAYTPWEWVPYYTGVATDKNTLGMVCMLFGVGSYWRLLYIYNDKKNPRRTKQLVIHGVIVLMTFWLLKTAHSTTSWVCLFIGFGLTTAITWFKWTRKPLIVHIMVVGLLTTTVCALFLGVGTSLVTSMGKDPTLTGRTEIWDLILPMAGNPFLGRGFDSFWLGDRLAKIWAVYWWHPNESHNGYIEMYLNLGICGLVLLGFIVVTGYKRVLNVVRRDPEIGCIRLALIVIALAYNCTEAAFKTTHPIWIFLFIATAFPEISNRVKVKKIRTAVPLPTYTPQPATVQEGA
jgi:exopolysaccharide production protein ExoQ